MQDGIVDGDAGPMAGDTDPLALDVHGLVKAYVSPEGTRVMAVDLPAFAVAAAEQVAVHGESGSGKTTFLHLVCGILTPDAGRIVVAGEPMTGLPERARDDLRGRAIGYVFQTFNLLQGYSAIENVWLGAAFGPDADWVRARALLERVGLSHRLNYRPVHLSSGQQQRVAIARALARTPRLVLADEPTGSLDPIRAAEALTLLREMCREQGAALLLVSHDPAVLAQFDRVEEFDRLNRACARFTSLESVDRDGPGASE
jgi:putative ABC transport system ATP-binding protein